MYHSVIQACHGWATRKWAFVFLLALMTFTHSVSAQTEEVSVLPQYFAANPLIRRDPLIEKMHHSLNTAMRSTALGLNENITGKLDELERSVSDFLLDVSVVPLSDIRLSYRFFDRVGSKTITQLSLESDLNVVADSLILAALRKIPVGPRDGDRMHLHRLLLFILSGTMRQEPVDLVDFPSFNEEEFQRQFKHDFVQYMKSILSFNFGGDRFEYNVSILQTRLNALIENMKGNLIAKKYELEDALDKVKDNASNSLLSANAGLGINQAEGNLGGGFMLTFKNERPNHTPKLSVGVFLNGIGELGTSDTSAVKQPFLAGFAIQYRLNDALQITGIGSAKYNEEKLSNSHWLAEVGGGLLYRTAESFIIGASVYYLFMDRSIEVEGENNTTSEQRLDDIFTAGITIRGNAVSSPTLLLGISSQFSQTTPVFQISYPIIFGEQ